MAFAGKIKIPVQEVKDEILDWCGIQLLVKRLDLIPSKVTGNKYFKLKYNLEEAKRLGHSTLLTFGGAYSNHILATSIAGKEAGFETTGVIRGEESIELNPVLKKAKEQGMELHYMSREQYLKKEKPFFIQKLTDKFGSFYLLPEGGSNQLAVKGCREIISDSDSDSKIIFTCCGTAATLSGIILSLQKDQEAIGISVLKNGSFLEKNVANYLSHFSNDDTIKWKILTDYHFGGYARSSAELQKFMDRFILKTGIPVEHVYTGKMFYAIYDLAQKGFFRRGDTVMAVHTGGVFQAGG